MAEISPGKPEAGSPGPCGALITSINGLPVALRDSVSAEERAFVESLEAGGRPFAGRPGNGQPENGQPENGQPENGQPGNGQLPFAVTAHFASLARPEPGDPIRRQFFPDPREALSEGGPFVLEDPLGEALYRVGPRLIHQYPDRVLLLAGGACAGYCRHCFRRVRMSGGPSFIGEEELGSVLSYLGAHPEIRELLVSGGDPLTAPDRALRSLFSGLRQVRGDLSLRVCTRVPVTAPRRISGEFIDLCRDFRPLRFSVHINHPRELAPAARLALAALVRSGFPVLVQTVLLRGINDSTETLAALFRDCLDLGLSPYYLFQLDLAPGTAHFRLPLQRGLALYRELRERWNRAGEGGELPVYAVDLPGGGGKIRLSEASIAGEEDRPGGRVCLLKAPDGSLWPYPAD